MITYEFDKNTGEVRFGGRLVAKIEMKDNSIASDLEDIFDFYKENYGFDFDELRDLQDKAIDIYKTLDDDFDDDIKELIGEIADIERW